MSGISWTDKTWNPVTGCTPVSEGCLNCYARRMHKRALWSKDPFSVVKTHPERLEQPLHWRKPKKIFVCSMSDLFHEDVPYEFIETVFDTIRKVHWNTFQLLTKRPQRVLDFWQWRSEKYLAPNMNSVWPDNCWLGVTAENQDMADQRIPILLRTPAAVRFVSIEPMLGPVDLTGTLGQWSDCPECGYGVRVDEDGCCISCGRDVMHYGLDWVIVGGESGPGARPMHPSWVQSVRDQCHAAAVPFHFKQWGEWLSVSQGAADVRNLLNDTPEGQKLYYKLGKKKSGRLLDGREWLEFPECENAKNRQ